MQDKIGEVFDGVISGVTDWGIYVELTENKCEGMISIKDLTDDFYFFDEKNYCITGMHNEKTYQLGGDVKVEVVRANLERKQLDFKLHEEASVDENGNVIAPSNDKVKPTNNNQGIKPKKSRQKRR